MVLSYNIESFEYDVYALLTSFYPGESSKQCIAAQPTGNRDELHVHRNDDGSVQITLDNGTDSAVYTVNAENLQGKDSFGLVTDLLHAPAMPKNGKELSRLAEMSKKDYEIVSFDVNKNTITIRGKRSLTGTYTVTIN